MDVPKQIATSNICNEISNVISVGAITNLLFQEKIHEIPLYFLTMSINNNNFLNYIFSIFLLKI